MAQLADEVRARLALPSGPLAREIRKAAGVTQVRMAAELGIHRMTLVKWETNQRSPRGDLRERYARLLTELQEAMR